MGLTLSSNKYAKTFNSFSGADIFIIFENATVGTITQLSWNITREKAPLYVLGHVDAVGTSRGKRSIAGSLTGIILDRWTLFDLAWGSDITGEGGRTGEYAEYARKTGDILVPGDLMFVDYADIYGTDVAPGTRAWPVGGGGSAEEAWKKMLGWEPSRVVYADQMLPCDVTIVGINEAGNFMVSRIFGIDLLSTGAGISIDDGQVVYKLQGTEEYGETSVKATLLMEMVDNETIKVEGFNGWVSNPVFTGEAKYYIR